MSLVLPWDGVYMDVLDYQWDLAAGFWTGIDALARANDVKVAIEMHQHNLVFSPVTLRRLVDLIGAMNIGAEMDPSHLMWQGMDIVACIKWLGPLACHAAAKDAAIMPGVDIRGVLDTSFQRVPADAAGKVPTGYGFWCNAWPENPAWRSSRSGSATTSATGRSSSGRWPRSTRTWPSTSSTRTPRTPSSTGWPWRPGTSGRLLRRSDP